MTTTSMLKPKIQEFQVSSIAFLGFIVSPDSIQMDPEKVTAIVDCLVPTTRKQPQRFPVFANFYKRFTRSFSCWCPLHTLTSPQVKYPLAKLAFWRYKESFTPAPILTLPDPHHKFLVEVNASDIGIRAVLSQRCPAYNRLHPSAFLSRILCLLRETFMWGTGSC